MLAPAAPAAWDGCRGQVRVLRVDVMELGRYASDVSAAEPATRDLLDIAVVVFPGPGLSGHLAESQNAPRVAARAKD